MRFPAIFGNFQAVQVLCEMLLNKKIENVVESLSDIYIDVAKVGGWSQLCSNGAVL